MNFCNHEIFEIINQKLFAISHKIFLSHNFNDKPLVEVVALRLASIFGRDQIFYDAWSISPGDGIIDRMNEGLAAPEFVFFFISSASLSSGMVKLEWQNALYAASKGKTKIIPVRIDESDIPPILKQTLYIDMHTVGLEAALAQIVSTTQGNASFTPQHAGFSNLSYLKSSGSDGVIEISIHASHLMEPNPNFLFVTRNGENEIGWTLKGEAPFLGGFNFGVFTNHAGIKANAIAMRPMGGALTPKMPFRAIFKKKGAVSIDVSDVFHQKGEDEWAPLPIRTSS